MVNQVNARRAEAATPPAGEFVEVNGVRLHYVEQGTGSPVVLLHSNGVTLQDFKASGVLGLAAGNHQVIAFDRPGFAIGIATARRSGRLKLRRQCSQPRLNVSA